MKGIKEATKITIKKSNREMYNFCDLCFKIENNPLMIEAIDSHLIEENDIDENVQESNRHDDIYFEDTNSFENDISQPGVDIEDEVSQAPVNDVQNNLDPWLNEPTF